VNTGIFFPAADTIAFSEGGVESMRIDSSSNVGIGTSSPTLGKLQITQSSSSAGAIYATAAAGQNGNAYVFGISGVANGYQITNNGSNAIAHIWSGTGGVEYGRFDTSGNLLVGTTSSGARLYVRGPASASYPSGIGLIESTSSGDLGYPAFQLSKFDNNTTTSQIFVKFLVNNGGTAQGQINANGASAAAFGSWSDSRLKENIVDLPSQLDNIMSLRPVEFDYIESEGGGHQIGFIAQEVQEIYPDLVGERTDGMLTLTDLNKNDARLIKAIQELKALVDTQASTITTLTDRITALEAK
jgi:hypothetical protein